MKYIASNPVKMRVTNDALFYLLYEEEPLDDANLVEAHRIQAAYPDGFDINPDYKPVEGTDLIDIELIPYKLVQEPKKADIIKVKNTGETARPLPKTQFSGAVAEPDFLAFQSRAISKGFTHFIKLCKYVFWLIRHDSASTIYAEWLDTRLKATVDKYSGSYQIQKTPNGLEYFSTNGTSRFYLKDKEELKG